MNHSRKFEKSESIGYLSRKLALVLAKKHNKALADRGYDVSLEQFILLVHLWENDGLSHQDLADLSGKDKASLTRLIDQLESKNIVVRILDKEDRRCKYIYLTKKGKDLQEGLGDVVQDILMELEQVAPREEVDTCKHVLRKMIAYLGE